MQFNESPFLEHRIPKYRFFFRMKIEKVLKLEFDTREKKEKVFKDFFGFSAEEKGRFGEVIRTEEGVELSDQELEDFTVFCKHAIKRILNAQSQKDNEVLQKLNEIIYNKGDVALDDEFKLIYHDISHTVGTIIRERHLINNNSIVPPIFEFKPGVSVNNREVMEDELYALLFSTAYQERGKKKGIQLIFHALLFSTAYQERGRTQVRLNFVLSILRGAKTYEDFVKTFTKDAIRAIRIANEKEYSLLQGTRKIAHNKDYTSIREQQLVEQEELLADIEINPPEKLLYLLRYLWDHRENPRVLVDLFFQEIGPFIEKLKMRKEDKWLERRLEKEN